MVIFLVAKAFLRRFKSFVSLAQAVFLGIHVAMVNLGWSQVRFGWYAARHMVLRALNSPEVAVCILFSDLFQASGLIEIRFWGSNRLLFT